MAEPGSERQLRDAKEGAIRGRMGLGSRTRVPSLPNGAQGPRPGEPPSQQPPTSRTKGVRGKARVRERRWREAGGRGREGASPHFLSRPKSGKLLPADASLRQLQNREGWSSLPNGCTRPLPPLRVPTPSPGGRPVAGRKRRGAERSGRNRRAAAPPAGAGRLRSHRAAAALKVELAVLPPARPALWQPRFHRCKSPSRSRPGCPERLESADLLLFH